MGLLLRRQRRFRIQARNGSIASKDKSKGAPSQQGDIFDETKTFSWPPYLPEEIWRLIHSLMPLRDAARAACVCRAFLCSWRSFPNLTFSNQTLGLNEDAHEKDELARDFTSRVDHIMKNHSGTGMKTLKLLGAPNHNVRHRRYLNSWLEKAMTQPIEELTLVLTTHPLTPKTYKLPCSILLHGNGDTIRYLSLRLCAFRPTVGFGCLRSLVKLNLSFAYINGDELGCILSNSLALESLVLWHCNEIVYVKIPCLQRLTHLTVVGCWDLKVIESKAPILSTFYFPSSQNVHISLGKALQVKKLYIDCSNHVCYTRAELASSVPNLEAVGAHPSAKMLNTSLVSSKFRHLESLIVTFDGVSQNFDCFSMTISSLEAFLLDVSRRLKEHPIYDQTLPHEEKWVHQTSYRFIKAWLS